LVTHSFETENGNDNDKTAATVVLEERNNNNNDNDNNDDINSCCDRIFVILEELEKQERIKAYPSLIARKEIPMDNHGAMIVPSVTTGVVTTTTTTSVNNTITTNKDTQYCDLSENQLRGDFSLKYIPQRFNLSVSQSPLQLSLSSQLPTPLLSSLLNLDLSRNELWGLPSSKAMKSLVNLETLDLSRNWFEEIPTSIGV